MDLSEPATILAIFDFGFLIDKRVTSRHDYIPLIQQLQNLNFRLLVVDEEFGDPSLITNKKFFCCKLQGFDLHCHYEKQYMEYEESRQRMKGRFKVEDLLADVLICLLLRIRFIHQHAEGVDRYGGINHVSTGSPLT